MVQANSKDASLDIYFGSIARPDPQKKVAEPRACGSAINPV